MTTTTLDVATYQATVRRLAAERLTYRQRRQIRRAKAQFVNDQLAACDSVSRLDRMDGAR